MMWPDLTIDSVAMAQARKELGTGADVHALLQRAQAIKDEMKEEKACVAPAP